MGHQQARYIACASHTLSPTGAARNVKGEDHLLSYDGSLRVKDCCIKSAAAPTYFPSHEGHVDGGMFANVGSPPLSGLVPSSHPLALISAPSFYASMPDLAVR